MMNKLNLFNSKKTIHKSCKSQVDAEVSRVNQNESTSSYESPLFGKARKASKKIFKTHDTRETLITEPSDSFDLKKSKTRTNFESERVRLAKERLKRINKSGSSSNLLKDQDHIIKLQNNLIDNLRSEISILAKGQTLETEEFNEKFKKIKVIQDNENFSEDLENEITRLKKCIKRKDDIIKELNAEMDLNIEQKDQKIRKLEENLENLKNLEKTSNSEDLRLNLDIEKREKQRLEKENLDLKEQVKVVTEENKILIQNYEEVRRRFFDHEKILNPIKSFISKVSNSKYDTSNIFGFIENLYNNNRNLNEKWRSLNEKIKELDEENSNLKAAYSKQNKKLREMKFKVNDDRETEILIDKLRRKSIKIVELKKMLSNQHGYRNKMKTSEINTNVSDYSVIESQMSVIEEELNLLKTENRILVSKENDLCTKLKNSEKARYYYQEQTIGLKEKVNYLENQLKMIEYSVQELKAQNESPVHQSRFKKN